MLSLSNITNTELQSKNDTVNKLIDVSIASNRSSGKAETNILEHDKKNNNKSKHNNEKDDIERSNNAIENHVKNDKINYSPKKNKPNDENVHETPQKKTQIEILVDSMVNGIEERRMNKTNQFKIKVRRYPGASSIDIIDHLNPLMHNVPKWSDTL